MNEQNDRATARLQVTRTEKEIDFLGTLLEAGRENLSLEYIEMTEKRIAFQNKKLKANEERLQTYMHHRYCRWRQVGVVRGLNPSVYWTFSYTLDKDGDGWYWWQVRKSEELSGAPIPMSSSRGIVEGKRRKKKDVKAIAEKKYNERIAQIREAKTARATGKEVT